MSIQASQEDHPSRAPVLAHHPATRQRHDLSGLAKLIAVPSRMIRAACVGSALLLGSTVGFADDDMIFHSGSEPGLAIEGRMIYPQTLAGAVVRARFGPHVASSISRADGSYAVILEYRYLEDEHIVELTARGTGGQAHIEWAGLLGSAARLQAQAADDTVTFEEIPFVNLGPRSTAVTAAMRADNGYAAIETEASFERSARSWQVYVSLLTEALALAANGDIALPTGAATTWQALSSLVLSQQLYLAHHQAGANCSLTPEAPLCLIRAELPTHPQIFPALAPTPGETYSRTFGYQHCCGAADLGAFRLDGSQWLLQFGGTQDGGGMQPVVATLQPNGSHVLERQDGLPLFVSQAFFIIGGQQVLREIETTRARVRLSRGVAGLTEMAIAWDTRHHHPNNPEIPDSDFEGLLGQPSISSSNRLPDPQLADVPSVSNRRWLLTTPFGDPVGSPGVRVTDIHAFGASGGSTERGGQAFSLLDQYDDGFLLAYGSTQARVWLLNQDYPGVWRTLVTISGPDRDEVVTGIAIPVDDPQPHWTLENAPGIFDSLVNGRICDGPYGLLEALIPNPFCGPPRFVFSLDPDGTGYWGTLDGQFINPMEWLLPGGTDLGRLLMNRYSDGSLRTSRGFEIVKQVGDDQYWVIENLASGPPLPLPGPASFVPSSRAYLLRRL